FQALTQGRCRAYSRYCSSERISFGPGPRTFSASRGLFFGGMYRGAYHIRLPGCSAKSARSSLFLLQSERPRDSLEVLACLLIGPRRIERLPRPGELPPHVDVAPIVDLLVVALAHESADRAHVSNGVPAHGRGFDDQLGDSHRVSTPPRLANRSGFGGGGAIADVQFMSAPARKQT